MNIQMKPGTIPGARVPIEEHHFTFVPSLVRLTDVGQVEGSETIWGVRWHPGHTSLIPITAMCGVTVIPDVDWDLQALQRSSPGWTQFAEPVPGWHKSNTSHIKQNSPLSCLINYWRWFKMWSSGKYGQYTGAISTNICEKVTKKIKVLYRMTILWEGAIISKDTNYF
jgi:hypothetical protein